MSTEAGTTLSDLKRGTAGLGGNKIYRHVKRFWFVYLLAIPGMTWVFIFHYIPIYGITIAFKDFYIRRGILGSPWVGLEHFKVLLQGAYFYKVLANTILINLYSLVFGFTFVIFLALMLNELKSNWFKRVTQTMVYIPHFVSWVVFAGILTTVLFEPTNEGVLNGVIGLFGAAPKNWITHAEYFRSILVISGILKNAGFGTIIYLAALASVNPELIESAICDGAHRGHLMWHIYLPRISPTIAVLLILNVAGIFKSNFEQVFNLYNPAVYETGDVLSTYLFRVGLIEGRFEMATALGLVFNILGLALIIITNRIISKMNVMGIF